MADQDRDIEEELARVEEVRALGPRGAAFADHAMPLLDQVERACKEHGLPLTYIVAIPKDDGKDEPALVFLQYNGPNGEPPISQAAQNLFMRMRAAVEGGPEIHAVPIPPELMRLLAGAGGECAPDCECPDCVARREQRRVVRDMGKRGEA